MNADRKPEPLQNRGKSTTKKVSDSNIKRKQAEELRDSEELHRIILSSISDAVFITDNDGKFIYICLNVNVIFGYSHAEVDILGNIEKLLGVNLFNPKELDARKEIQNIERRIITKNGVHRDLLVNVKSISIRNGTVLYTCRDITERKQTAEALQEAEIKYRTLVERLPVVVYTSELGINGRWHYISPQITDLLGFTADEWLSDPGLWYRQVHPEDRNRHQKLEEQAWARKESFEGEYRIFTRDGRQIWIRDSAQILPPQNNGAPIVQGVLMDITERKLAEDALAVSEVELRALFASMNDVVLVIDRDGIYQKIAPTNPELLYKSSEELLGKKLSEVFANDNAKTFMDVIQQVLKTRQTASIEYEIDVSGRALWFETFISPMDADNTLWVARDVTERKQAEQMQAALYEIANVAQTTHSINDLFASIHKTLGNFMPAENFYIAIYDAQNDLLGFPYFVDQYDEAPLPQKPGNGLTEYVLRTRQPLLATPQVFEEMINSKQVDSIGIDSVDWIGVPLTVGDETFGVMVVQTYSARLSLDQKDLELLTFVSTQAAMVIKRKQAEEALRQRTSQLESLREIGLELTAELNLDKLLLSITAHALDLLHSTGGGIYLHRPQQKKLELVVSTGTHVIPLGNLLERGEGLCGKVWEQRKAIVVDDYEHWEGRAAFLEGRPFKAVIGVPIIKGDEFLGVLVLLADFPRSFNTQDASLLELFAGYAAGAIHSARLFEETRRRAKEFAGLYQTTRDLSIQQDLPTVLAIIAKQATTLLNIPNASITLYDPLHGDLELVASIGPDLPIGTRRKVGDGLAGRVAQSGKPVVIDDYQHWADHSPLYDAIPYTTMMGVPLLYGGNLLGVLDVSDIAPSTRTFNEADVRLLSLFAGQASSAIANARLFQETVRRLENLQSLRTIDNAISGSADVSMILEVILGQVISQLGADAAVILLFNPAEQILEYAARRGFRTQALQHTRLRLGEGYAGRVAQEGKTRYIADIRAIHTDFLRSPMLAQEGFISYHGVPLIAKGEIKGVLEVFHRTAFEAENDWLNFLETLSGQTAIAIDNTALYKGLQLSNIELTLAYDATIEGWSRALDLRDKETEGHTQRVTEITLNLAKVMGFSEEELINIRRGALLHDIGKMGIPDSILLKPGELTHEEWEIMHKHPIYAYEMLTPIAYLKTAFDIPYCHHEKWDGTGYPRGLKGEDIPPAARIFAIVDVWDAIRSDRPYRQGWAAEKAIEYIQSQSGTRFDPKVVEVFLKLIDGQKENLHGPIS